MSKETVASEVRRRTERDARATDREATTDAEENLIRLRVDFAKVMLPRLARTGRMGTLTFQYSIDERGQEIAESVRFSGDVDDKTIEEAVRDGSFMRRGITF